MVKFASKGIIFENAASFLRANCYDNNYCQAIFGLNINKSLFYRNWCRKNA